MKINKEDLLEVLSMLKPAVAKKKLIEQATHFIFIDDSIVAYNDMICISYPFETGIECSVPSEEFSKFLSKIKGKEIDLQLKEDELIISQKGKKNKIRSGLKASVDGQILDLVSSMELSSDRKWKKLPKDFLNGLELCMYSASSDQSHPYYSCVLVSQDVIIATDSEMKIATYQMEFDIKNSFFIPALSAIELSMFDVNRYFVDKNWIYFKTEEGLVFCSRIIKNSEGQKKLIDGLGLFDFDGVHIPLPENFSNIVDAASIFAPGDFDIDKNIEIEIENGIIKCRAEKDVGWIEAEEEIDGLKNKSITFLINSISFLDILKENPDMFYGEKVNKAVFSFDSFRYLLLLEPNE